MSKVLIFDAKDTVLGKEYAVLDSMKNIKLVSSNVQKMFTEMDAMETKKHEEGKATIILADYSDIVYPLIIDGVVKLLGLTGEDKKKLEDNVSFDEIKKFYEKVVNSFLDMQLPTNDRLVGGAAPATESSEDEDDTDPKLKSVD